MTGKSPVHIGDKFGYLTVVSDEVRLPNGRYKHRVVCDCGKETIATWRELMDGHKRSCGCLRRKVEEYRKTNTRKEKACDKLTHKHLYSVWSNMRQRCENPRNSSYKSYGGRGISVCIEWLDFRKFEDWALDSGYDPRLTIDRINNDGDYTPENCRWATKKEQCNNQRKTVMVTIGGETRSARSFAEENGISPDLALDRIKRGWDPVDAVTRPPIKQAKRGGK